MGGSRTHTHRLVMERPGVFHCVYCGERFGEPPRALPSRPPLGPLCCGPIQTRLASR